MKFNMFMAVFKIGTLLAIVIMSFFAGLFFEVIWLIIEF